MIVRLWWPLQAAVRRKPLYACAALAGLASGSVVCGAQLGWPHPLLLAIIGGLLALMVQIHGVAGQTLAGAALLVALIAASLCAASPTDLAVLAPGAALLLGASVELARRRPAPQLQYGIGRGTTLLTLGMQLVLMSTFDRPVLLLGFATTIVIGVTLVMPLVNRASFQATTSDVVIASVNDQRHRWLVPLVLLTLCPALAWNSSGTALTLSQVWPVLLPVVLFWVLLTVNPVISLAVSMCSAGAAAVVISTGLAGDRAAIGVAQIVPLLTWMGRTAQGGILWPIPFGAAAVLAATALMIPGWMPAGIIALGTTVGLACCPDPRPAPGIGLAAVRRWLHRLDHFWRWYGLAKLRLDPLYEQLDSDRRPWGRMLDVGCGPGLGAALAAARPDTTAYHGIDLDRDKLLVARRVLHLAGRSDDPDWRLEQATAPLSHPPSGPFDTIFLLDVLHYWPLEIQTAALTQLHTLLADDGVLWLRDGIVDANRTGRVVQAERITTWFGLNPRGGLHFLSEDGLRNLVQTCGFTISSMVPSGGENRLLSVRKTLGHVRGHTVGETGHEGRETGHPATGT